MMILNQGAYLRRDLRPLPPHKEELAHRPSQVSTLHHQHSLTGHPQLTNRDPATAGPAHLHPGPPSSP